MSFEPGGRSDKYGNDYENKIRVRLFLRIITGDLKSITVEPLGDYIDSVEYIAKDNNNINWHYQCKGSNGANQSWTTSDLDRHKVFTRSKEIILSDSQNRYIFVSPLSYGELSELCKRARTNASPDELVKYQLCNVKIKKAWNECAEYFKLDTTDSKQLATLVNILANCYFETVSMGLEGTNELNDLIGLYFTGSPQSARMILEDFVTSDECLGVPITADEIILLLEKNGHFFRKNLYGENNIAGINEMNRKFRNSFLPIDDSIIHRLEADEVVDAIDKGNSVVLHGKAGVGKSGCVCEIIDKLTERNTLFLALKLENDSPSVSTDVFGKKLGLAQSPVCCLHNISAGKPCVLILDQLDALRWTNKHSADALDVCKEFIRQAKILNQEDGGHISLVFITRTFDLENDNGLKDLFSERNNTHSHGITWSKIQINPLTKDDVNKVLGEEYCRLSLKLQEILLVPSSLYIWTQLRRDSSSLDISTPFELMERWWKQILDNCENNQISRRQITEIKDFIVNKIEFSSSSWLPKMLFSDYSSELQALVSNGLLIENDRQIAFSHQSFLDYFAVSDMLKKIYSGSGIINVIGTLDKQTPYIRYRLLRVLQTLPNDQLLNLCREIMDSNEVRYYFKATVFEVLGQVEHPNNSILEFTYSYLLNQDWHEYVLNSVYFGHTQYILSLDQHKEFNWLDKDGLDLLYSINAKSQDFLLEKIKPLCLSDKEDAMKIYYVLGHNCSDDSPAKLELRMKLYNARYDFFDYFMDCYMLIKNDSLNLIPILKLIIQNSNNQSYQIYLGKKDINVDYSKRHYREIIKELLSEICEQTMHFNPSWPNREYNFNYSNWTKDGINNHPTREIVEMVNVSLCEFASVEPESFLKFIKEFDGKNSVVYYELISNAVYNLGIEYSDDAINWLSSDPNNHFFIYTENGQDYLSLTKKIIEKFSKTCSNESFQIIENIILRWSDPVERMLGIYKLRLEVNQDEGHHPVYYAYWGHLQKELLPFLDSNRISKESKELIQVLNRNNWINVPFYYQGWSVSSAMTVHSPIAHKLGRISDKTWKKIISTPNNKMNNPSSRKEKGGGYYIEANHVFFSQSLAISAKKEPVRFAKLSLSFPCECFPGYITGVIRALYEHDESIPKIDFSLICNVINCFISRSDKDVIDEILRLIESRADEIWPDNIVEYVCNAAMGFSYPSDDSVVFSEQNRKPSPNSLLTRAINSVRGSAIKTMAQLLYYHRELSERFKPIVRNAINDSDQAIRFFSITALFPFYSVDRIFCINALKDLIQNEISVLGYPGIWELICRDYHNNSEFYTSRLIEACFSDIEGLGEEAASCLCAIAIYYDFNIAERLYKLPLSINQCNNVCHQAVSSFADEQFNQKSKEILLHYIDEGKYEARALIMLFSKGKIDISRDEEFLIKLIMSTHNTIQLHTILNFINEQDQDISKFANVLYAICQEINQIEKKLVDTFVSDLIGCVIKLLDKNNDNLEIKKMCLEMWDNIYRSNFNKFVHFSQLLDNLSE